jgi:hypothetical protein
LAWGKQEKSKRAGLLGALKQSLEKGLKWFIHKVYAAFLALCIRFRIVAVAVGSVMLILILGYVNSGRISEHFNLNAMLSFMHSLYFLLY